METERAKRARWQRAWNKAHPEQAALIARKAKYKRMYGITLEQYDAMLEEQDGKCAICFSPPLDTRLAVDHSHVTGEVRSLLCRTCNTKLGVVEDEAFARQAAAYLARFK